MSGISLQFLGAAGGVTGSRYLLHYHDARLLIDCGLFQGRRAERANNRAEWGFDPATLSGVCLTHAHLDHSGLIPRLVADGYHGPVFATSGTVELCRLLWPDSAYLQEEEASYRRRRSGQATAPLYTRKEADVALDSLQTSSFSSPQTVGPFTVRWQPAGHILGAASVIVEVGGKTLAFPGDVGRPNDPLMRPPQPLPACDYLITESTYGDRTHAPSDLEQVLGETVADIARRGGVTLIPAFAVGRAQTIGHLITRLKQSGAIPRALPVFLNSPMAINAADIYCRHMDEHRLSEAECARMCEGITYVRDVEESKALNRRQGPMVIIAASGMLSGGRILHHLIAFGGDRRNAIFLCGYQAEGTRGRALLSGRPSLRIFGKDRVMRARVVAEDGLSGHADADEMVDWLSRSGIAPAGIFVTHGEDPARGVFAKRLEAIYQTPTWCPSLGDTVWL